MANDQPPDDPFRVRLSWPGRSEQSARLPGDRDEPPAPTSDVPAGPAPDPVFDVDVPEDEASVLYTVANRLEGLRAALGTMGLRLDALIRRDEEFREFTTARLAEYAEQIAAGVGTASAEMEETSRSHARSLTELTTGLSAATETLQSLVKESQALVQQSATTGVSVQALVQQSAATGASVDRLATALAELTTLVHDQTALGQDEAAAQMAAIEAVRVELTDSIAHTEERDEELGTEVGHMAEELRALRRRMTVRAAPVSAARAPVRRRAAPEDDEVYDDEVEARPARATRAAPRRARPAK